MLRHKKGVRWVVYTGLLAVICMTLFPHATYAAGGKVVVLPDNQTLTEGASQAFTVQLNQPIIVSDMTRNYVHLNVVASDPSRVSISPNPVEYLPADWWQTKSFTVTALANATYNDSGPITLTITADSGAAYYDLYVVTMPLSITDTTPAPSAAPAAQVASATTPTAQPQLIDTGLSIVAPSFFAFFTLLAASIIRLLPRKHNA